MLSPRKMLAFGSKRNLRKFFFLKILSLTSDNTSFNFYRTFVMSHGKTQFQLDAKCVKRDSVSYSAVLNIKMFDMKLKHF